MQAAEDQLVLKELYRVAQHLKYCLHKIFCTYQTIFHTFGGLYNLTTKNYKGRGRAWEKYDYDLKK